MKIALVVQQYASDLLGGAEIHARKLSCLLKNDFQNEVEILTTRSKDYQTWENYYPKENQMDRDIKIIRFSTKFKRLRFAQGLLDRFSHYIYRYLPVKLQNIFDYLCLRAQGPYCPDLLEYLEKEQESYDLFIFFTYLYYPTAEGVLRVKKPKLIIPTAHDENYFYRNYVKNIFENIDFILPSTLAEKQLISSNYGCSDKMTQLGIYLDDLSDKNLNFFSLKESYLLYLGRIGKSKSTQQVIKFLSLYNEKLETPIKLVLAGPLEKGFRLPKKSWLTFKGTVDDKEKELLLKNCAVVINPSYYESLSLLILEGIQYRKPCLVNVNSQVLEAYSKNLTSVYGYKDYDDFKSSLDVLCQLTRDHMSKSLDESYGWLEKNYSRNAISNKLKKILDSMREKSLQ